MAAEAGAPASVGLSKAEVDAYIATVKAEVDLVAKARPMAVEAGAPASVGLSKAEVDAYIATVKAEVDLVTKARPMAVETPPIPTPTPTPTPPLSPTPSSPVPATLNQQMTPAILNRKPTVEKLLALIKPTERGVSATPAQREEINALIKSLEEG